MYICRYGDSAYKICSFNQKCYEMPEPTFRELLKKLYTDLTVLSQNANKPTKDDAGSSTPDAHLTSEYDKLTEDDVIEDYEDREQDDQLKGNLMDIKGIEKRIEEIFKDVELEKHVEVALKKTIKMLFDEFVSLEGMKTKLQILFEYEEHYLKLIKEYKEEIKFCNTMQEDLRRERSQFFTQILKEVSDTLKKAEVESSVASQWIQDLVDSYTKSIDISSDLAKSHVIDVIGKIRNRAKKEISPVKSDDTEEDGSEEVK